MNQEILFDIYSNHFLLLAYYGKCINLLCLELFFSPSSWELNLSPTVNPCLSFAFRARAQCLILSRGGLPWTVSESSRHHHSKKERKKAGLIQMSMGGEDLRSLLLWLMDRFLTASSLHSKGKWTREWRRRRRGTEDTMSPTGEKLLRSQSWTRRPLKEMRKKLYHYHNRK